MVFSFHVYFLKRLVERSTWEDRILTDVYMHWAERDVSGGLSVRACSATSWRNRYTGWSSVIAEAKKVIQAAMDVCVLIEISSTMVT